MVSVGATAYIRKASGLIRTASLKDVFMFNVYFTSFTLAVVFVYVVGLFAAPSGNMVLGLAIATVLFLFQVLTYALMSAIMPRSGGDYIYVSRILHPALGSLTGWAWVMWLGFWVGFGGFTMVAIGLGGLFTTLGLSANNEQLLSIGSAISTPTNTFIIGFIVILLFALLAVAGMRAYFRAQIVTFSIGVISLIISYVILLSTPVSSFIDTFNSVLAPLSNNQDLYHAIINSARQNGLQATQSFSFSDTMLWIPAAYIAIPWTIGTIFIGAEVKNVKRNQILGAAFAYLFVALITLSIGALLIYSMGYDFLSSFSYLVFNPPSNLSVPIPPYFNYLIFILVRNPILSVLANLGFIFLGWMYMVQNLINTSRILMAMSFDRTLPEWFSRVSDRFKTPVNATLFMFIISLLWLGLITFTPYFLVASSIFALNLSVLLVAITALVLPFVKKELFDASPVRWRIGKLPFITLVSLVTVVLNIFTFYIFATQPAFGASAPVSLYLVVGIWVGGLLAYLIAKYIQRARGIDVDLLYKEIPEV